MLKVSKVAGIVDGIVDVKKVEGWWGCVATLIV